MIRTLNAVHEEMMPSRDDEAGFGCLETARGCLPLVAMDVAATISGLLARTTVKQTFRNSLDEPLEATYIFPLPDRAAVTSFRMRVGDRVIEGQLKERGQARKDYQKAIEDGHRAALAEEDRSGTFCIQVGNIPSKEDVSVELTLVGPLPLSGGEATFRFPLVVAPRYTSGIPLDGPSVGLGQTNDTDEAPDASRVTPPVLLPGFPNPVALTLEVELDPQGLAEMDAAAERFSVSLHSVMVEEGPPWKIRLQPGERLNRDFILRFPVAAAAIQTSLIAASRQGEKVETFALTIVPPVIQPGTQTPRDLVIVLDRSGSMGGWKMVAARRAVGRIVDSLLDEDRFSVIAFDNTIERPPHTQGDLIRATDRARWQTIEWLGTIDARGGTEMAGAMTEAIRLLRSSDEEREPILVLVTDGQVSGEDAILRSVKHESPGGRIPRIHTIGIDRAVNAGFLRRLADAGGGTCDLVESEDRLDAAMDHIHRGIAAAALTNLRLEVVGGSLIEDSLAPAKLPDLFADRPITIFGQCRTSGTLLKLRVLGVDFNANPWETEVAAADGSADTIRSLWGRVRVRDLEDRYAMGVENPKSLAKEIVAVSLATNVLSRFTAYVAVDRSQVVNKGGQQQQVVQPVEMPNGWDGRALGVMRCSLGTAHLVQSCLQDFSSTPKLSRVRTKSCRIPLHVEPEPQHIEEVLAEIGKLSEPVRGGLMSVIRNRRTRLLRLLEMLHRLMAMIGADRKETQELVQGLAEETEQILEEHRQGNKEVLKADRLNEFFIRVCQAIETIETSPQEKRKEFWM
jgi:Ca-activated chloride channel family protein